MNAGVTTVSHPANVISVHEIHEEPDREVPNNC